MPSVSQLEHWKGGLSIAIATLSPFGAWAMGESSLKGAAMLGVVAGLTAGYNWLDESLSKAKARKSALKAIAAPVTSSTAPEKA